MATDVGEEAVSEEFMYWQPLRRNFSPDSPFFASGNIERELIAKQVALDLTEDDRWQLEDMEGKGRKLVCPIVGCGAHLNSLESFEAHYNARHIVYCSVCSRVYPTSRLLSTHISEVHDSFFQAKVARGFPMYECLVETCGLKFKSYKARQQHLVDKHKFPSTFEFYKKSHPSKKLRQKHQRKQVGTAKEKDQSAMQVEDETMDALVSAVSRLKTPDTTPSSVSFGRRRGGGFALVPRSIQRERRPDASAAAKNG